MYRAYRSLLAGLVCLVSLPGMAAFVDNGNGTVTDTVTGLMWDKCSWGQSNLADCSGGAASLHVWDAALAVSVTANAANHRGHGDWRLPNASELESLVKITAISPAIDLAAFPSAPSLVYWTSTTHVDVASEAKVINFDGGFFEAQPKTAAYAVRLVRTGGPFAAFDSMAGAIPGVCGAANGVATAFAPATANLCAVGAASAVSAASPWTWSCAGVGGGSSASCSAPNANTGTNTGLARSVVTGGWVVDTGLMPDGVTPKSAGFIPATGHVKSPPSVTAGYGFPHGLYDVTLTGGVPGSMATLTITFPTALPSGTVYWKYGPSPDGYNCSGVACAAAHWYQMPAAQAVVAGNTVTLSIIDGGVGDDDLMANGVIVDAGGPGAVAGPQSIPTLSEWGLIILSTSLGVFAFVGMRRKEMALVV